MKGASEESNVSPDRFSAGQTADGLINDCLEDGCSQVFLGSAVIDQRLDI